MIRLQYDTDETPTYKQIVTTIYGKCVTTNSLEVKRP